MASSKAARRSNQPARLPAPRRLEDAVVRRRTGHRLIAFLVLLALSFGLIVTRLADLQVVHASRYVAYGDRQRLRSRALPAARGSLVDRNGHTLAMSIPRRSVFADPTLVVDPQRTARRLAGLLNLDADVINRRLHAKGRFSVLAHTVPDATAARITKLRLPGIATYDEFKRYDPNGPLARSLLGRVTSDGIHGTSGLEKQYDKDLVGRPGHLSFEKANGGGTIAGGRRVERQARPGATLSLTVDQAMQYETERELAAQVVASKSKGGVAIITRPSTGEILAMANVKRSRDGRATVSSNNTALTAQFEPGSVNKVITLSAALQEGIAKPSDVLTVPYRLRVADHTFSDHDPHPTAQWSVTDILATSSNIGTIEIAQRLGPAKIDEYLRKFGFGVGTGLGFPNESPGAMLALNHWSGTSIGAIPIGQGVAVTAMQMLAAYNVIANDGRYVAPRLVNGIDRGDGKQPVAASSSRQVVSPATALAMRAMMAEVVKSGTGKAAAVPGYPVAGKTGTARKPQPRRPGITDGYQDAQGRYHYVSTFVGFVPADNPDLSIIVVLDEPTTSIFASDVAAPLFSRLASYGLRLFHVPPPSLADSLALLVPKVSADAKPAPSNDVVGGAGGAQPLSATTTTPNPTTAPQVPRSTTGTSTPSRP